MPSQTWIKVRFFGLNIVRVLSIISLLLVFASSIVTLVHDVEGVNRFMVAQRSESSNATSDAFVDCDYIDATTVPNQPAGVFWAVLNRLMIIGQVVVLILSEIGRPMFIENFFAKYFPVLGRDFGLGALGIFQTLLGAAILSHFVDDFALVSAFFLFSIGCLNMFLGLLFRASAKSHRSILSWREEKQGTLPRHNTGSTAQVHFMDGPSDMSRAPSMASQKAGYGFGRQGEKAANLKGFMISKPVESLPRY